MNSFSLLDSHQAYVLKKYFHEINFSLVARTKYVILSKKNSLSHFGLYLSFVLAHLYDGVLFLISNIFSLLKSKNLDVIEQALNFSLHFLVINPHLVVKKSKNIALFKFEKVELPSNMLTITNNCFDDENCVYYQYLCFTYRADNCR